MQTWARSCPVGPTDPGGSSGGIPRPRGQPREPPPLLTPTRVPRGKAHWPGGSQIQAPPPQRPRGSPAAKGQGSHGQEGPAELRVPPAPQSGHHLCARSQQSTGDRNQGSGYTGQTRPGSREERGEGKWGRGGARPGLPAPRVTSQGGCGHTGTRPVTPAPAPGGASRCTSRGQWPSPSRSGPPRSCPGAAGPGSHVPPGPAGGGPRVRGRGHRQASGKAPASPTTRGSGGRLAAGPWDRGLERPEGPVVLSPPPSDTVDTTQGKRRPTLALGAEQVDRRGGDRCRTPNPGPHLGLRTGWHMHMGGGGGPVATCQAQRAGCLRGTTCLCPC